MTTIGKKRRYPTASSPNESEDDNAEQPSGTTSQAVTKRRGSVAADFAPHRLIVSERQQMAVLKQLTAGEESNTGSQSPSSVAPPTRPAKINRRNEHGETIVHIAARKGDLKQLKKVLKAGANVNEADNAGWTPLHEAVTKNQFKAARLLLKSGANVNAPGPEGQTPLVDAVLNNNAKMAELLLNSSADPSVLDISRLNETMTKVVRRELSVLDSSDNENNDDDSTSPLSPLTSENDYEHDEEKSQDKQLLHVESTDLPDRNPSPRTTSASTPQKKPYRGFRERSSQSSDSSSQSKTRTASGNNELASSAAMLGKNPYDFESEEEGEIRESTNEAQDESQMKKKSARKADQAKQRTQSGGSTQLTENMLMKKRLARLDLSKEQEHVKIKPTTDDDQLHRIPPLKIVLARAVVQRPSDTESLNSSTMDENPTATMTTIADTSALLVSEPTSEVIEKPLATSVSIPYPDVDDKVMNPDEDQPQRNEPIQEDPNEIKASEFSSPVEQVDPDDDSSPTIIYAVLETLLTQIESNLDSTLTTLTVIEDGQMELDDDVEDDEMDDEEEVETDTNTNTNPSTKSDKAEDERTAATTATTSGKPSISSRRDLKPTTRTLRSHARGKMTSSASNQTSSSNPNNHGRRVSNRRRVLESRSTMMNPEKERKRRTISERSRKEKDNASTTNEDIQTSSNSDDQMTDNPNMEKVSQSAGNPHDDASSCSSTGAGEGSSTSSSTIATKQTSTDLDSFPPSKRRVRERNAGAAISNTSAPPHPATDTSANSNSNSVTEHSPADSLPTREMPINGIKQFLEIRQQIDKRHETMLNEFVLPKVPKDFAETTMAKKNYLIAPSFTSYSINTPASMGIRRCHPPHELDGHLSDVFAKQEDERYKMKLRHQVERDKLILSHEQEVLRLYGNATRSSMNQEIPFSYCSLLKDNEVYNNPAVQLPDKDRHAAMINTDGSAAELGKRGKHRWNGRSFIKWLEDSNLKYKRLSCEISERQRLEADTLYSMQRMVWSKHLPKESLNLSSSGRPNHLLNERYLPKVEINPNFWTHWETSPF